MIRFDGTQLRLDGVMHRPALSEAGEWSSGHEIDLSRE